LPIFEHQTPQVLKICDAWQRATIPREHRWRVSRGWIGSLPRIRPPLLPAVQRSRSQAPSRGDRQHTFRRHSGIWGRGSRFPGEEAFKIGVNIRPETFSPWWFGPKRLHAHNEPLEVQIW
jgi:hypothetical protein